MHTKPFMLFENGLRPDAALVIARAIIIPYDRLVFSGGEDHVFA